MKNQKYFIWSLFVVFTMMIITSQYIKAEEKQIPNSMQIKKKQFDKKISQVKELKFDKPISIRPGSSANGGAQAWQGCMNGHYYHRYEIKTGINQGEVWLCCVPVNELLRDSFKCGGQGVMFLGDNDDQKIQTCSVINAESTELEFIPVCIPAPLSGGR